jgi:serine O-acetyltransferase
MSLMQLIVRLQRVSFALQRKGLTPLSRLIELTVRLVYGACLPAKASIAPNVIFYHNALGVVLNHTCVISSGCQIGTHVLLGGNGNEKGAPHLDEDVVVHAGAKLFGPIRVGRGAVIGANSVVMSDVPEGSLVTGVLGSVKKLGIDSAGYKLVRNVGERSAK